MKPAGTVHESAEEVLPKIMENERWPKCGFVKACDPVIEHQAGDRVDGGKGVGQVIAIAAAAIN